MRIYANILANMSRIHEYSRISYSSVSLGTSFGSRIVLLVILAITITGCTVERPKPAIDLNKLNWGMEAQIALQKAQEIYLTAKNQNTDFSSGPCLSNTLHGNADYPETMWVLDIAHNPREAVDDLPTNQCSAYRDGQARNFIELDPNGQVIQIYSPFLKE